MGNIYPGSPDLPPITKTPPQASGGTKVLGIDVSHYEPSLDWVKAKASGVVMMYAKATEGTSFLDPSFKNHCDEAKSAGVKIGVYHFFHAALSGLDQANFFLNSTKTLSLDLPCCLDWESSSGDGREEALLWLGAVEKITGKTPVIYGDYDHLKELNLPQTFARYPLWVADYSSEPPKIPAPWVSLYGWQYTDSEGPPRIEGLNPDHHVDASWFYI